MADSPSSTESNPRPLSQDDPSACSGSEGFEQSSQGDAQRVVTTTFDQGNQHTRGQSMYQPSKEITKVFQDPIHGTIELNHVYMKIIDTPEFQRLRNVKQLGTVNFVYAGAVHTRFEHSIGTCYLALRLIRYLKERQKNLGITDEEELCVGLAALCHDLGHGPFSHMFDSLFIPKFKPENYENWSHELGAVKIFDDMVKKYDLKNTFERLGYNLEEFHYHMIKEMIYGPLEINGDGHYQPATEYQATYPDKYYLYEIVSNKTNQIDVDKWDYFARDSYHLGVTSNFIHDRFMKFAKVFSVRKNKRWETQICYRDKEAPSAYEMFHTRYRLYRMACYHPVTVAMDLMKSFFMKDMLTDMEAYRVLDDNILNLIRHSYGNEKLVPAREILQRMQKREIYKLVARFQLQKNQFIEDKDVDLDEIVDREENIEKELKNGHLCFKVVTMDYGLKDENPVDRVLFYSKGDRTPRRIAKDRVSFLLPHTFEERQLYFYVKDYSKKDVAAKVINAWAREKQWILESQNIGLLSTVTDLKKPTTSQGLPQDRKRKSSNTDEHDVESAKRTSSFNETT